MDTREIRPGVSGLTLGVVMHTYEIRILSQGRTKMVIEAIHLSDYAAIRAGEKLAAGRMFEVWRGTWRRNRSLRSGIGILSRLSKKACGRRLDRA